MTKNKSRSSISSENQISKVYSVPESEVKQVEITEQKLDDLEESKNEDCNVASSEGIREWAHSDP